MLTSLAIVLLAIALGTPKWIESDIVRTIQKGNNVNSSVVNFKAGYKYMGMFRGCEEKDYGNFFAARKRCFDAFDELKEIATTQLAYTTLISSCLGLSIMVILVYVAFYIELVRSIPNYMRIAVPCITSFLTIILKTLALGAYLYLYNKTLKISLLSKRDQADGFSTKGRAKLGYSFWLMVTSLIVSIASSAIICGSVLRSKRTNLSNQQRNNKSSENAVPMQRRTTDGSGMMIF